eukprot:8436194-Alexandrium_andersonii.AAC.1
MLSVDLQESCTYVRFDGGGAARKTRGWAGLALLRGPLNAESGTTSELPVGGLKTALTHRKPNLPQSVLLSYCPLLPPLPVGWLRLPAVAPTLLQTWSAQ